MIRHLSIILSTLCLVTEFVHAQQVVGIDVSHHQGTINWEKVKWSQPDIEFVYVKCSEGKTYVDPKFKENAVGAAAVGYKVGAYHYFRMTSSAHEQYDNFKAQMDAVHIDLIPMVDVERSDGKLRKELQDSLQVLLNLRLWVRCPWKLSKT